jgi:hypothetical protein
MDRLVAMHGSDQTHFIGMLAQLWNQLRHPQSALSTLMKLPRRSHQLGTVGPTCFPLIGLQLGLVIEGIDVRGSTLHAQEDHMLGLGRKMRFLGS